VSVIDTLASIENVTGTNLADYIVGSAEANVITGGAGADTLTGGAGADTFVMVAADAGDTITDFTTGTDFFDYNTALLSIGGQTAVAFQSAAAATAIGAATTVFELTGTTTDGTAADLVAELGATATNAGIDAADSILFVNYLTAGGAQIWRFVDADGANVDAVELTLLATLQNVAADALVAADFI
jgi:Ca2+-binding RTX toxin-like protein